MGANNRTRETSSDEEHVDDEGRRTFLKLIPFAGAAAMVAFVLGIRKCVDSVESIGDPEEYLGGWKSKKNRIAIFEWSEGNPNKTVSVGKEDVAHLLLPVKVDGYYVCDPFCEKRTGKGGIYKYKNQHVMILWYGNRFNPQDGTNAVLSIRKNGESLETRLHDLANESKGRRWQLHYANDWELHEPVNP